MRAEVAAALWRLAREKQARKELRRLSASEDPMVREVAARALGEAAKQAPVLSGKWRKHLWNPEVMVLYASPWLVSNQNAAEVDSAFDAMFATYFGYSDRQLDMERMIPDVMAICLPLVRDLRELLRLCRVVPDMIRSLPEHSMETPYGYTHSYDTRDLEERTAAAKSLDDLLAHYDRANAPLG